MSQLLPEKVVILGASGRMGKMLMQRGCDAGLNMHPLNRPYEGDKLECLSDADLAILCVPARTLPTVLKKIVPYLNKNAILSDIISVKETPMRQMEHAWSGPVVGTHPLFGPNPPDDMPVVIVRGSGANEEQVQKVANFYEAIGCRVFESTAEKHDIAMARIQNMNFITNLAYFAVLAGQDELLPFLTPSFERRKQAAAKMLTEDAEMFAGLFEANGHSHEAVRQYRKMLNLAASGDIELLCKRAQWWWRDKKSN